VGGPHLNYFAATIVAGAAAACVFTCRSGAQGFLQLEDAAREPERRPRWGTYSDIRLKTVSGGFGGGLAQVMQLRPIRYRYKPDNAMGIRDGEERVGVVAQEVRRAIPEAVTENSKGYLIVNNDPVIWSMVNAIQEQQKEIEAQRKLIREQSRAMKSLTAEVRETPKATTCPTI